MTTVQMRAILLAWCVALAASASARTILVPTQHVSPFADTEVSTNIVLHASRTDTREFGVHIQLAGTPTNDLEVAFGRDSNTNGVLEAGEVETVYGWRAGRYFVENVRAWERIEAEAAASAQCGVVDIQLRNDAQTAPRRFAAACGGVVAFTELATTPPPSWLFREEWDMVRVTRRGAGVPLEWVRCDVEYASFAIKLR